MRFLLAIILASNLLAEHPCQHATKLVSDGVNILHDLKKSKSLFEQALLECPDFAPAHYNLGIIYLNSGDLVGAESSLVKTVELRGTAVDFTALADVQSKLDKRADAVNSLNKALEKNAQYVPALLLKAVFEFEAKNYESTKSLLEKAFESDPKEPAVLSDLGFTYYQLKDFKAAREAFQKLLKLQVDNQDAYYGLALIELQNDQFLIALKYLEKLNSSDEVISLIAYCNLRLSRNEKVIEALAGKPWNGSELAIAYYNMANYAAAIKDLEFQVNTAKSAENLTLLGLCYEKSANFEKAIEFYRQAISVNPQYEPSYYNLSRVLEATGKNPEAKQVLENLSKFN